jgi:hypothetical protein
MQVQEQWHTFFSASSWRRVNVASLIEACCTLVARWRREININHLTASIVKKKGGAIITLARKVLKK